MTDTVEACPVCDEAAVEGKTDKPPGRREHSEAYRCKKCGEHFDEPVTRARRGPGGTRHGLSQKLAEANPDDVRGPG